MINSNVEYRLAEHILGSSRMLVANLILLNNCFFIIDNYPIGILYMSMSISFLLICNKNVWRTYSVSEIKRDLKLIQVFHLKSFFFGLLS